MNIVTAPPDVLSPIFEFLSISDLSRLSMVGNMAFYRKLWKGNCVNHAFVSVPIPQDQQKRYETRNRFPFLKNFTQLTILQFYPSISILHLDFSDHGIVLDDVDALLLLKLRRLVLKINFAWNLFFDSHSRQIRALNRIYPDLTHLEWYDTKPLDHRLCTDSTLAQLGRHMPRNMTLLHMGTFNQFPQPLVDNLPHSIFNLKLRLTNENWKTPRRIPNNVEEITFDTPTIHGPFDVSILPDEVQSLCFQSLSLNMGQRTIIDWKPEMKMPSNLTVLRVAYNQISVPWILNLPRSLTELIALNTGLKDEDVPLLPSGLRILRMGGYHVTPSSASFRHFPPLLTSLKFSCVIRDEADFAELPSGLHTLKITTSTPSTKNWAKFLPREITNLALTPSLDALEDFPPKLVKLSVTLGTLVEPHHLAALPSSILKLSLRTPAQTHQAMTLPLPPHLTKLVVKSLLLYPPTRPTLVNARNIASLPKTLTHLHLPNSILSSNVFPLLPPGITHFRVEKIFIGENVSEEIAKNFEEMTCHLPRTPGELAFDTSIFFSTLCKMLPNSRVVPCERFILELTSEVLRPLPKALSELTIQELCQEPQPSPKLSPSSTLTWDSRIFPPSAASHFTHLKKLVLHGIDASLKPLRQKQLVRLPTSLTHLEVLSSFEPYSYDPNTPGWLARLPSLVYLQLPDSVHPNPHEFQNLTQLLVLKAPGLYLNTINETFLLPRTLTELQTNIKVSKRDSRIFYALPISLRRVIFYAAETPFRPNLRPFLLTGPCTALLQPTDEKFDPSKDPFLSLWLSFTSSKTEKIPSEITEVIGSGLGYSDSIFDRFPSTVTKISLIDCHDITTASVSKWPPCLTDIQLGSLRFSKSDIETFYKRLSSTQTNQTEISANLDDISEHCLATFDDKTVAYMIRQIVPSSVTAINIRVKAAAVNNEWITSLPASIRTIALSDISTVGDNELKRLPSALSSLSLPSSHRFTKQAIAYLPPSLLELVLPLVPATDASLKTLPPNLVKLVLSHTSQISDATVPHLPKTLEYLDLSNSRLTEHCFPDFPRKLKFLHVKQALLTGEFSYNSEVISFTSIVRNALNQLPLDSLEVQPILEFEFEKLTAFGEATKQILLPASPEDIVSNRLQLKPGTVVNLAHSTTKPTLALSNVATIAPAISTKTSVVIYSTWLLKDPNPPHRLLETPHDIKDFTIYWNISTRSHADFAHFPPQLEKFVCFYAQKIQNQDLDEISRLSSLQELHLIRSNSLDSSCLKSLPSSITCLSIDLIDIQPDSEVLSDFPDYSTVLGHLPPKLANLTLNNVHYEGFETRDLRRPKKHELEN